MDDGSMLPSIVMPFMPVFNFDGISQMITNGQSWSHLFAFMNATLIYGIIAYFAIPKKLLKRYGNARYFVSLFISWLNSTSGCFIAYFFGFTSLVYLLLSYLLLKYLISGVKKQNNAC